MESLYGSLGENLSWLWVAHFFLLVGRGGEAKTRVCGKSSVHGEKPNHRSPGAILPKKCSPSKDRCWQWADYPDGEQLSYLYFWYKGTIFFCSKLQCKLNKVTSLTLECFWCIARGKRHLMSKYMQKVSTFSALKTEYLFCMRKVSAFCAKQISVLIIKIVLLGISILLGLVYQPN